LIRRSAKGHKNIVTQMGASATLHYIKTDILSYNKYQKITSGETLTRGKGGSITVLLTGLESAV
jgi:hypothetical protein